MPDSDLLCRSKLWQALQHKWALIQDVVQNNRVQGGMATEMQGGDIHKT